MTKITGKKLDIVQKFTPEGERIVVTRIKTEPELKLEEIFKPEDRVKVSGWSKGKGFAGVVKRWGFKGGPKTHGQSDRQRAPGSIGMRTTPGRVHKGKKMAGRMGRKKITLSGLPVVGLDSQNNILEVKGLVPGPKKGVLIITKMEEKKNAES